MVDIDPLTGLPKELLAMEEIVREQQSIKVHIEKRRYGKLVTVIDGIGKGVDINDLAKQLKMKCATGGTSKGGQIELQGDHTKKVNEVLSDMGFPVEVQ
jgi:translation initiation factor 1